MSKQTNTQAAPVAAPVAQASDAPAPVKLTMEACEDFGRSVVSAFAKFDRDVAKAGLSRMETIMEALAEVKAQGLNRLTASDYARTLGKSLGASIDKAVAQDKLQASTAAKLRSQMKAVALATLNGLVTLKADDGFAFAYEASVKALAEPSAQHVYEGVAKAGVRAGTASPRAGTGKRGARPTPAPAANQGGGTTLPAAQARAQNLENAALALAMGDRERAARFVVVATRFAKDFDAWASDIIAKAEAAKA